MGWAIPTWRSTTSPLFGSGAVASTRSLRPSSPPVGTTPKTRSSDCRTEHRSRLPVPSAQTRRSISSACSWRRSMLAGSTTASPSTSSTTGDSSTTLWAQVRSLSRASSIKEAWPTCRSASYRESTRSTVAQAPSRASTAPAKNTGAASTGISANRGRAS